MFNFESRRLRSRARARLSRPSPWGGPGREAAPRRTAQGRPPTASHPSFQLRSSRTPARTPKLGFLLPGRVWVGSTRELKSTVSLISNRLASLVTRPSPIHRIRIVTRKRPEAGCIPRCRGCPPCPAPGCSGAAAPPVYAPSPLGTASSGRRRRCHLPNTHLRPSLPLLP